MVLLHHLLNYRVLGKSKMSFESDQAVGINRVYNTNEDIKGLLTGHME
jgi:hypothetical protein